MFVNIKGRKTSTLCPISMVEIVERNGGYYAQIQSLNKGDATEIDIDRDEYVRLKRMKMAEEKSLDMDTIRCLE